jgi:hypothetical protein
MQVRLIFFQTQTCSVIINMFIKRKNNYKFKISHVFNDNHFLKEKLYWINDKVVDVKKTISPPSLSIWA